MFYHVIRLLGLYLNVTEGGEVEWVENADDAYRFPGLASAKHWGETLLPGMQVEYWPMPYKK